MEHLGVYWLLLHRKAHLKNQPGVTVVLHFQAITMIGGCQTAQHRRHAEGVHLSARPGLALLWHSYNKCSSSDLQQNPNGQIEYPTSVGGLSMAPCLTGLS